MIKQGRKARLILASSLRAQFITVGVVFDVNCHIDRIWGQLGDKAPNMTVEINNRDSLKWEDSLTVGSTVPWLESWTA